MADIQNNEPVAYFYELTGVGKELVLDCNGEYARKLLEAGYTETPLFTRAAPPAMDREAVERVREAAYRQALEDVCNPLGYLQRMADAEGAKLSGMAYAIASDIGTIQRIAKEALSTLSADAIRQGEGLRAALIAERDRMKAAHEDRKPGAFQSMCALNRVLDACDGGKA
ncbi:hypothetical protein ACQKJZ_17615 [Sphingomonas sp. NPDC019816]|uniref:hypothetical protein n=1 Tax=Sphingomonas sp. NPDC019816 TaxID=3390679 RepID=UPI003D024BA8